MEPLAQLDPSLSSDCGDRFESVDVRPFEVVLGRRRLVFCLSVWPVSFLLDRPDQVVEIRETYLSILVDAFVSADAPAGLELLFRPTVQGRLLPRIALLVPPLNRPKHCRLAEWVQSIDVPVTALDAADTSIEANPLVVVS
ncbi:hypothetical protein [Halorubrum sp. SP9]|uniref:hypothetical protein n=1 Tax=Halorubrum sp. SP9 TaxID=1537267 RepID=UPI0010F7BECE|nr:hypothetical protein [Halorubrum sp. SP9]TKX70108.1 hypothetical protein EXE45_06295 [Halorubrum sp. SP9]